jgi:hypothetical protein
MKKTIRLTESDLARIVKRVLNEDVNANGVSIGTDAGKVKIGGCKYNILADMGFGVKFNVGSVESVADMGDKYQVNFDNKTKTVDKNQVVSQIGKFKGCPSQAKIEYEISSFAPNINLIFTKA